MKVKHIFKTALIGLKTNKFRSFLTILGIVIGITSIILIMSLGNGAQSYILNQIQGQVSSRVIEIKPGRQSNGPSDFLSMFSDSLKQKDVDALSKKSNVPNLSGIMPLVFGSGSASFASEIYQVTFYGMSDMAGQMYNLSVEEGRFLSDDDVKSYSDVAVIGAKVREKRFVNNEEECTL